MGQCHCGGKTDPTKGKFISAKREENHKRRYGCKGITQLHEGLLGIHCTRCGKPV